MGRDVRLRISIFVVLEDPVTEIQHVLRLEALLLTFPENMSLNGVEKEAGAAVKSTVQCIIKVMHCKGVHCKGDKFTVQRIIKVVKALYRW